MKKLTVLSMFLAGLFYAGSAHATGSAIATFLNAPNSASDSFSTSGSSIVGMPLTSSQWPTKYDNISNIARNVYWNFGGSTSPFGNGDPGAAFYGTKDSTLKSADKFTAGGTNAPVWNKTAETIGLTNPSTGQPSSQTGTVTYTFNGSTLNSSAIYIWAQIDVTTNVSGSYVSFNNLTNVSSAELFNSSGTLLESTTSSVENYDMTGTSTGTIYDAYFAVTNPTSSEALTLKFLTAGSHSADALVNNLHIAMTPEPISMALFATGVAVLFMRRRRIFQLA